MIFKQTRASTWSMFLLCPKINPCVRIAWKGNIKGKVLYMSRLLNVMLQPPWSLSTLIFVAWFILLQNCPSRFLQWCSLNDFISFINDFIHFTWPYLLKRSLKDCLHSRFFLPRWNFCLLFWSCWFYAIIKGEIFFQEIFLFFALKRTSPMSLLKFTHQVTMGFQNAKIVYSLRRFIQWWQMHMFQGFFRLVWLTLQIILQIDFPQKLTIVWPHIRNCWRYHKG